jgi:hypothetical protein
MYIFPSEDGRTTETCSGRFEWDSKQLLKKSCVTRNRMQTSKFKSGESVAGVTCPGTRTLRTRSGCREGVRTHRQNADRAGSDSQQIQVITKGDKTRHSRK